MIDPQGPATGSAHVVRGGGWNDAAGNCRSASLFDYRFPYEYYFDFGFRVVLASGNPCLNNNGGCLASQTCSMSSGGRICSGPPANTCGVVQCSGNFDQYCQTLCGGVCIPSGNSIGSPHYCDNSPPRGVNTCDIEAGCFDDSECQFLCGGVCLPGDLGGGSRGHCDNSYIYTAPQYRLEAIQRK